MNKQRRMRLDEAHSKLLEAQEIIEEVMNEEQDAFDNLPESLQGSERGEQMEEYIGTMQDAYDGLDEYLGNLYEIIEG